MAKPLPIDEIRRRAGEFVRAWQDSPGDERQDAQKFVRHLLSVFGVSELRAANYEHRAKRSSTGQQGYIDALIPGRAVIEMKSAGKHLPTAEKQARDYLDDLSDNEFPQYIITSDFHNFRISDIKTNEAFEFPLADFAKQANRLTFLAGTAEKPATAHEQEQASIKAAKLMGSLYEELEKSGYPDDDASIFLVRTLFCLYADDAGIWEPDLFIHYILNRTSEDALDLGPMLIRLFQWLSNPPERRQKNAAELLSMFPYVNGDVFSRSIDIPELSKTFRQRLIECADFNWSSISPAVFGSLFQSVKDKKARRELGEHYTTERNILRLINPMFLDELHNKFDAAKNDSSKLRALRNEIKKMRFLDPACGCGNFLLITYRELRKLDLEILQQLQSIDTKLRKNESTALFITDDDIKNLPVNLSHFHGIEIEEFPAEIARTALHIADHQANMEMMDALGEAPPSLPLDKVDTIKVGNSLRTDWATVVEPTKDLYIMGNPPFLGMVSRSAEQVADLDYVWGELRHGSMDYITGWYAKALQLFSKTNYDGQFAFVSTNSITQGEPVAPLFQPVFDNGWRIKFAHRTFAWTSEAAGAASVHCVIIGYDKRTRGDIRVWNYPKLKEDGFEETVKHLNAYLVEAPETVLIYARQNPLSSDLSEVSNGNKSTDGGHLIVEPDDFIEVMNDPIAAKYVRPYLMGRELLHNNDRWCLWMEDFDPADVRKSNILMNRLDGVKVFRQQSKLKSTRDAARTPQLFWWISPQNNKQRIGIPRVSSESRFWIPCKLLSPEIIAGDKVYTCIDADGFAFGIISSSIFMAWQKAIGGRLKSDITFGKLTVWNTFPLPKVSEAQRQAIIDGGKVVLEAREAITERAEAAGHKKPSLADLYNPLAMNPELLKAHAKLDKAVDGVFKLSNPTDAQRLAALFKNYQEMTTENQLALPKTKNPVNHNTAARTLKEK